MLFLKHIRNKEKQKNTQQSTLVIKKNVFTHKIDQKFLLNFMCFSEYWRFYTLKNKIFPE